MEFPCYSNLKMNRGAAGLLKKKNFHQNSASVIFICCLILATMDPASKTSIETLQYKADNINNVTDFLLLGRFLNIFHFL